MSAEEEGELVEEPLPAKGLQPLTAALLECVTPADVVSVIVERGISIMGADAGLVALVTEDGKELELVQTQGYPQEVTVTWRRFPIDEPLPLSTAVREKRASFVSSGLEWDTLYPQLINKRTRQIKAAIDLPLIDGDRAFAGLHLSFPEERPFSIADRAFAMELAHQCSLALSRALLRAEAERSRRRLEFLVRASETLSSTLDYEITLENLARLAVPELADCAQVHIASEDGATIQRLSAAHRIPELVPVIHEIQERYPPHGRPSHPVLRALVTGEPQLTPIITDEMLRQGVQDPEYLRCVLPLGLRASLTVPLIARGRALGAMMLLMTKESGRTFTASDIALAQELARRAGVAVENARLYAKAQEEIAKRTVRDERLTLAIEAADLGTWHLNIVSGELTWSDRCKALFGLPPDEVVNPADLHRLHPDDQEPTRRAVRRAIDEGADYDVQYRSVRPNGSVCWIRSKGRAYYDASGRPVRFEGIMQDIDEAKQAELRRNAFFHDVLLNATDGRLRLCDNRSQLPPCVHPIGGPIELTATSLHTLRRRIRDAALDVSFPDSRLSDLLTAADEAAMNAVVHGGGGTALTCYKRDGSDTIQVRIDDSGPGISMDQLPSATLQKGYTTAGTMGFGFKLIVHAVDRVWLATGSEGTSLLLEQSPTPPAPNWLPSP